MGVGCALLLIVGTIYSLLYNNGRWVKNMDMSEYVFSYKDIPMLVIGALIALYAIYIIIICFKNVFLTINEQISNFAQTYPTNLKASSNEALLFMRRYRFANCSCFSCCFKDAYPSSNVQ